MPLLKSVFILCLGLLAAPSPSRAATATEAFTKVIRDQASYLAGLPLEKPSRACSARYNRLWQDGVLEIALFYGYLNGSNGFVLDRLTRRVMTNELTRPCKGGLKGACGFSLMEDHSDQHGPVVLQRKLGRNRIVRITLQDSAWSEIDAENTIGLGKLGVTRQEQAQKTREVFQAYLEAIANTEVVIYDGHSRHGSGPSFGPYGVSEFMGGTLLQPNWRKTIFALKQARKKPEVMMFASCVSQDYYLPKLMETYPGIAFAGNETSQTFGTNEQMVFSFIDSLVLGRCEEEINKGFHAPAKVVNDGRMRIFGFE